MTGNELWKTDGTESGTVRVKGINPGPNPGLPVAGSLVVFGGVMLFQADDGVAGSERWKTDGTEAGTVMVKDISATAGSFPSSLTVVGDKVMFVASGRLVRG